LRARKQDHPPGQIPFDGLDQIAATSYFNQAAAQNIWESSGCICNMLEIAEESGMTGGSAKVALQL
jgi:hypothetical protein